MSAIYGCLRLDGAPVERALLERMQRRLAHRGRDGADAWQEGAAGLGHIAFHTTPEAARERQPLASPDGALQLVLDGRIDNRDELARDLAFDTDADLVLQAYRRWGEDCAARLVGDFAFALWDARARRLFCAVDAVGMRQLYYHCDGRAFVWATECRALFEYAPLARAPNEPVLAQHLCDRLTRADETLFKGVARLPAAHALTVAEGRVRVRQYWRIDPARSLRYRDDDEYGEHFRAVFGQAVRSRLRSPAPVAVDLSGGLDSSSIAGMIGLLRAGGTPGLPEVGYYSLAFPGLACDERSYVEAVARHWGFSPVYCQAASPDARAYAARVRADYGLPIAPNGGMADGLRRLQASRGARVVLGGIGGDEWFTGGFHRFADLLRRGRLGQLAREALEREEPRSLLRVSLELLREAAWPQLPLRLRAALGRVLRPRRIRHFVGPALSRHLPPAAVLHAEAQLAGHASFDQAVMAQMLASPQVQHALADIDRFSAPQGWEMRAPFMDRRLIEFAFALPLEQRWRHGFTKHVMRHALRDALPALVARRADKADFSHVFVETLRGAGVDRRAGAGTLARLGWLDADAVRRVYAEMLGRYNAADSNYAVCVWPLWQVFAVDTWMNELFSGGSA